MRGRLLGLLLPLLCAGARAEEPRPLTLAFFAPTAPLGSVEGRFAYVEKLARQLQAAGIPAQGKVFARAADLEGALRRAQVDLAILDSAYLAEKGLSFPVLAVVTAAGEPALRWSLYTSVQKGSVQSLFRLRLAWAVVGTREPVFLDTVLLDGELKVAQTFDLRPAPDIAAAVSDVVLRRAECVFAPDLAAQGKGLRRVYDAGRVPNPALVLVQSKLPRDLVERAQRVLLGAASMEVLDGFQKGSADPYRQLRQRLLSRGAPRRLLLAEPQPLLTEVHSGLLVLPEPAPSLSTLKDLFVSPAGIP